MISSRSLKNQEHTPCFLTTEDRTNSPYPEKQNRNIPKLLPLHNSDPKQKKMLTKSTSTDQTTQHRNMVPRIHKRKLRCVLPIWVTPPTSISRNHLSTNWTTSSILERKLDLQMQTNFWLPGRNPDNLQQSKEQTIASHFCDQLSLNPKKTALSLPNRTAYAGLANLHE
jgi:hypothetical protein